MLLGWFNARKAAELGMALADAFPLPPAGPGALRARQALAHERAVQQHLERAALETRSLQLNFYKRARFANSFKWRLLERGADPGTADGATQTLVLLSLRQGNPEATHEPPPVIPATREHAKPGTLLKQGDEAYARGAYSEAASCYEQLLALKPRRIDALNKLGGSLCKLGRFAEAEKHFRAAIGCEPGHPDAHGNLGAVQLARGCLSDAESSLRRALKLQPANLDHRSNLGVTLASLGRLDSALAQFDKVTKVAPHHANTLYGMGVVARAQGRFDEAQALFRRALEGEPTMARAWAALAGIHKMSAADGDWLRKAEQVASDSLAPYDEAGVRFAIGKYHDDAEQFEKAFRSYERGNELLKTITAPYEREMRTRVVDDLIRAYTPQVMSRVGEEGSPSTRPVFVVGMARSGTSLTEQIIASHPSVAGAGELEFWNTIMRRHEGTVRSGLLGGPTRKQIAEEYLRTLEAHSATALRVIDKAPVNSDYLGVILSVFPNARIIYMQRDPVDTCLSCYFQPFSTALNFTLDLSDLAHYYREHQRLMAHWREVLPPGSLLEVPYEGLVADQELWTRRMLDFLGLEWDPRCLEFHRTERAVLTSSFWQVRQRIYSNSVRRSRHYRKFLGPLLDLRAGAA